MTFYRLPFAGVEARRNLHTNPEGGVDTTGYGGQASGGVVSVTRGAGGPVGITGSRVQIEVTGAGTAGGLDGVASVAVVPGQAYTFTGYCWRSFGGVSANSYVQWLDGAGTQIGGSVVGSPVVPVEVWSRVVFGAGAGMVAPAGAASALLRFRANYSGAIAVGQRVLMTGMLVEIGASIGAYFAGSTPDEPLARYDWLGAENASASVLSVPSGAEQVTPVIPVAVPYQTGRRARTIALDLAESSAVRTVLIPAAARSGEMLAVFATPAEAVAAQAWFATRHEYALVHGDGIDHADMRFVVTDGEIALEQGETLATTLRIPFKEITG